MEATTTATQALEADFAVDAWGNVLFGSAPDNPFVFLGGLGYWQEPNLGLNYVRARWLNPATGTWLSVDPVATEPRYSYAHNSPSLRVDPSGTQTPGGGTNFFDDSLDIYNQVFDEKVSITHNPFLSSLDASGAAFAGLLGKVGGLLDGGWRQFVEGIANLDRNTSAFFHIPIISEQLLYASEINVLKRVHKVKGNRAYNWVYLFPPLNPVPEFDPDLIEYEGGFLSGIVGTVLSSFTTLPSLLLQAIYEIFTGKLPKDLWKYAKEQWGSLVDSFDQLPNMKAYDRGKLCGTLLTSAVLAILTLIGIGKGISAFAKKIANLPAVKSLKLAIVIQTSKIPADAALPNPNSPRVSTLPESMYCTPKTGHDLSVF